MMAFAHYVNFLTFSLVVDSCQTEELDKKRSRGRMCNTAFRLLMHCSEIAFVCIAIWGPHGCEEVLYPWPFLALIWTIVAHVMYDMFLYKKNYFVKLHKMPMMSENQMRFNKELFEKQTKCLLIINIIFGVLSTFIVVNSYLFIQGGDGIVVLCYQEKAWQALNFIGTAFVGIHQILIMLQIKMSQHVLIKIPAGMKLFFQNQVSASAFKNLRQRLLTQLEKTAEDAPSDDSEHEAKQMIKKF